VMLGAVERRFGNELPASPVEWRSDNCSCYRANETRQFAPMLGLEPKNTAVRSPESNGKAEPNELRKKSAPHTASMP
ncbi:IS3 family transposase, partial [Escherichia coli]|nr:IS3 family transposase [Escherichia coli]